MFFTFNRAFHGLYFDILDPYKRLILFLGFYFGKMWKFLEKQPFFRADMAGLGKYGTGGYDRIGVYRVKYAGFHTYYYIFSLYFCRQLCHNISG